MKSGNLVLIGLLLIAASALLFLLHYAIFHDAHLIFIYGLHSLALLPIEVLLVTLVIDRLISANERRDRQYKINMVIGAFFSTVGQPLIRLLSGLALDQNEICNRLALDPGWSEEQIKQAEAWVRNRRFSMRTDAAAFPALRDLLCRQCEFMVRLLENPMLLEHEAFSDLLWAVFHLQEELAARPALTDSGPADLQHLADDAERAYTHVLAQWLVYMIHLKRNYPFLFSFAARTNPLRSEATVKFEG